ncbi:hypothetical protein [Catalinimonas niigatensis]|uniref:hypothetical protein n=1 Tax=Catalinimonas niigatensis TaxID=1397264 RepID=UPI0026660DD2|nr:hypothetical protein [Catalinimonas niigatensis]WPP52584.1 hypothetical protein PZB72_09345 [Catalinimonas niigatensis]
MQSAEDLSFLRFFLTEPIYLLPETEPVKVREKAVPVEESSTDSKTEEPVSAEHSEPVSPALSLPETEGDNKQGVLLLFYDKENKSLNSESKLLLEKILKSVNLTFEDIALCNWAPLEAEFENQKGVFESIQKIKSTKILAFGELPLAWSLSHFFQKYHITQDAEGKKLLLADDLLKIAHNREFKVQLWNSLQQMF